MKKALTALMMALLAVSLFISCGNDPFFHYVEFDSNGGTAVERQVVRNGEKATKPEDPTKDGAEFLGWYNGDDKFDFDTGITKDYKLTAKWSTDGSGTTPGGSASSSHTVTFISNGGSDIAAEEVKEGNKATRPENPTKEGYNFAKWTTDEEGKYEYTFDSVLEGDITLYAQWNKIYKVGDEGPAGGIIFYVADSEQTSTYTDSSGQKQELKWKYLEVASAEATVKGSDKIQWSSSNTGAYGIYETAIGSGWSNTFKLLSVSGATFPAAQACADYGNGTGYDDWFLPSKDELNKIYENRDVLNTTFKTDKYWSSSEAASYGAWRLDCNANKWENEVDRDIAWYVRPIRAFV